ncbi:uncharacterized protein I206_100807 [Kwoniella pini CBS 10737]|uniref:Aminotransferase class I/classII large domain-containing protein n=1 Tax=Kwoniella pini CBS 10737 TaxID=1296096 RepID=A0A1B9IC79_9TREE|nr:uncharacterized protein I206_00520 [Kwoniella pini CBS 10737]OCF53219.1 hypothetical protein I206_00520 [Kwoniella pini CBS 10737]
MTFSQDLSIDTRYSLQAPCGLPSPLRSSLSSHTRSSSTPPSTRLSTAQHSEDHDEYREPTSLDDIEEPDTLMSCFGTLSISSLPPISPKGVNASGPIITRFPKPPPPRPSSILGTREEQRKIYLGPKLSDRATGGPDAGPLIDRFSCLFQDQYDCVSNPKGIVSLGVAENFLMQEECLELISTALKDNFTPLDLSYGDSLWGSRRINRALAGLYNDYFDPAEEVKPEQIITGVGCSAVLDQLFYTLMDEGEGILLAAPYYTGFDRDLIGRGRVRLIPVHVPIGEAAFGPESLKMFEEKLEEVEKEGIRIRAVIVCNPQNPLGRTYPRSTLLAYAKFCEEKDLHLVSDEIYALSIYDNEGKFNYISYKQSEADRLKAHLFELNSDFPQADPFTSMLSLNVEKELGIEFDKARLHVVYGMSKDFCSNGLRVGSLISQHNPLLLRAMANTSMLMKISSPADVIWSTLLLDSKRLKSFINTNKLKLTESHKFTRNWFIERGIEVSNSNAGNFIWVNLGKKLKFENSIIEKKIFQKLLDGGVYIAPGSAYHYHIAGWFRVTFTVPRGNLIVGLGRIERLLNLRPLSELKFE